MEYTISHKTFNHWALLLFLCTNFSLVSCNTQKHSAYYKAYYKDKGVQQDSQQKRKMKNNQEINPFEKANEWYEQKKYHKAKKLYSQSINENPQAAAYFNRGLCYYQISKYKLAIQDFERCTMHYTCTNELKERAIELIHSSEELHARQLEQRGAFWASMFSVVAVSATSALQNSISGQTVVPSINDTSPKVNSSFEDGNDSGSVAPKLKVETCGTCQGKGYLVANTARYSGEVKHKYCAECGKDVPTTHYHKPCPVCKGKGYRSY